MKASSRTLPSELNATRSLSVSEANYRRCIALLREQAIVELISELTPIPFLLDSRRVQVLKVYEALRGR